MNSVYRIAMIGILATAHPSLNSIAASRAESTKDVLSQLQAAANNTSLGNNLCTKPGVGKYGIVSLQDIYSDAEIQEIANQFSKQLRFPVSYVKSEGSVDIHNAKKKMHDLNLNIAFFLVNDKSLPMSLISLEEYWGLVNVAKIIEGVPDPKTKALRMRREMARVTKALLCAGSKDEGSVAVAKACNLEALPTDPIDINSLMYMVNSLRSFGLEAPRTVPYYRACKEGWAPAPTNDYQKAIWDKVHAAPKTPMKIEFDPKKGR